MIRVVDSSVPTRRKLESVAPWLPQVIVAALGAAAASGLLVLASLNRSTTAKFNDFYHEVWPAYQALQHGHVLTFIRVSPAYVGSLILRAPAALIPRIWGGGWQAVYLASAVPCIFAAVALCSWLALQARQRGGVSWASRISPIVFLFFNPAVIVAVVGDRHPEEILGAVLCIGGVVLAARGRVGWASFLIGLSVVNKAWALVAVPVALAAMPADRRRGLLIMGATAGSVLIPVTLLREHAFSASSAGAQLGVSVGDIFNPTQLLWWFGAHSWVVSLARPGFVGLAAALSALWWAHRRRSGRMADPEPELLLLLTLVLLVRAAFDPWNNLYYHVPFLIALMAYEVRSGRMPLLTVIYEFVLLVVVPIDLVKMSPDLRAALYAAIVVPTMAWMVARLYLTGRAPGAKRGVGPTGLPHHVRADEMTAA